MNIVHVHLVLTHVPVIGVFLAIVLFAYALLRENTELAKFTLGLMAVLAVVSVAVFFTGEPAEEAIENLPGMSESIVEAHEEAALIATIAMSVFGVMAVAGLLLSRKRPLPRGLTAAALVSALALGGLMGWTANLGGQIRHTEIRPGAGGGGGEQGHERGS